MLTLVIYLYAGYIISKLVMETIEYDEPEFLWEYHKQLKAPWSLENTKVILKVILIAVWVIIPFFSPHRKKDL